MSPRVKNIANV